MVWLWRAYSPLGAADTKGKKKVPQMKKKHHNPNQDKAVNFIYAGVRMEPSAQLVKCNVRVLCYCRPLRVWTPNGIVVVRRLGRRGLRLAVAVPVCSCVVFVWSLTCLLIRALHGLRGCCRCWRAARCTTC
jgi:hypothetical protein